MTALSSTPAAALAQDTLPPRPSRIRSIDALRGIVILLMLVDHTRESFFYAHQVGDPMDLTATAPALFFTRLTAHLCAPVFVFLTGLAAWLYGAGHGGDRGAAAFLVKRGAFLVVLEVTVVNFAWTFDPTPSIVYLQVIWAIGLSMIALAAMVRLPRWALVTMGLVLVLGHNLLDGIRTAPDDALHVPWAILHQRSLLDLPWGGQARTSYPVLPWIGVIALGYGLGPWFARGVAAGERRRRLLTTAAASFALFVLLRATNVYGDPTPWRTQPDALHTAMSVLNLTKYPPSADFLLLTLGVGLTLLALLERFSGRKIEMLAVFGGVPLFFYLLHLYLLYAASRAAGALTGSGDLGALPNVASLWLVAALVAVPCWFACRAFTRVKRGSDRWWMRYL